SFSAAHQRRRSVRQSIKNKDLYNKGRDLLLKRELGAGIASPGSRDLVAAATRWASTPSRPGSVSSAGNLQQTFPVFAVVPPGVEIGQKPAGPFHGVHTGCRGAGLNDLGAQLVGVVEERVHEVFRPEGQVPVLAVGQVTADNLGERGSFRNPRHRPSRAEAN